MADDATKERPTVTVDIDGEAHEVELPDGYIPETKVREEWTPKSKAEQDRERAVNDAIEKAKGKLSADLMNSDDFLERLVDLRGEDLRERLGMEAPKATPAEVDIEKVRKRVQEQEVEPLKSKYESLEQRAKRLEADALKGSWGRALREAGVADVQADLVELWLEKHTIYDDEHGPVAVDEDGKPDFMLKDGGGHRPKTPADLLNEIKKSGDKPHWFEGTTKPGVGANAGGGPGRTVDKKIADMSEAEKTEFRAEHGLDAFLEKLAKERAEKPRP